MPLIERRTASEIASSTIDIAVAQTKDKHAAKEDSKPSGGSPDAT